RSAARTDLVDLDCRRRRLSLGRVADQTSAAPGSAGRIASNCSDLKRFLLLCSSARLQACENAGLKPRATDLKKRSNKSASDFLHSALSVIAGSPRAARHAGIALATPDAVSSSAATPA